MLDDDDNALKQEEIERLPWKRMVELMNHNDLKKHLHECAHKWTEKFPARLVKAVRDLLNEFDKVPKCDFAETLKRLFDPRPRNRSLLPKQAELHVKAVEHALLAYQRDLPQMLWNEQEHRDSMLLLAISLLRLVEEHLYYCENEETLMLTLELLNLLMLRDAPAALIMNSLEL